MSLPKENHYVSWLRLTRASAIPSAISNILIGFLMAMQQWAPASELIMLILCSCSLYASGMVLNDICDLKFDRELNPERPLPSNSISKRAAWIGYFLLTAVGLTSAYLVGYPSFSLALLIVVAILLYDWLFKKTAWGPIFMGGCRTLNVLLGGSCALKESTINEWPVLLLFYAFSIGILVTGLTYFGRNERRMISQNHVNFSAGLMAIGGIGILLSVFWSVNPLWLKALFAGLLVAVCIRPANAVFQAAHAGSSDLVRQAVLATLKSFILIDAVSCLLAEPAKFYYSIVVAALLIPAKLLGRWISST